MCLQLFVQQQSQMDAKRLCGSLMAVRLASPFFILSLGEPQPLLRAARALLVLGPKPLPLRPPGPQSESRAWPRFGDLASPGSPGCSLGPWLLSELR